MKKITCYVEFLQEVKLKKIASAKGCRARRGRYAGRGSISKLLQAIAEGELTVVRLKKPPAAKG